MAYRKIEDHELKIPKGKRIAPDNIPPRSEMTDEQRDRYMTNSEIGGKAE